DAGAVGSQNEAADLQRDCVAGSADFRVLRSTEGAGARAARAAKDGAGDRCVFFGEQSSVDSGQRRGGAGAGAEGGAGVWDDRYLAPVEAKRWGAACDGSIQCFADDVVQYSQRAVG